MASVVQRFYCSCYFDFHAGIDGFSRLVTFLQCSDNNQALTVLKGFRAAVVEYGFPSRVRCDYGGENVDMTRLMITTRGAGRGSVITGSSTHITSALSSYGGMCDVLF